MKNLISLNVIVGLLSIVYGCYSNNNICVTLGCMNLILAKLMQIEKKNE